MEQRVMLRVMIPWEYVTPGVWCRPLRVDSALVCIVTPVQSHGCVVHRWRWAGRGMRAAAALPVCVAARVTVSK